MENTMANSFAAWPTFSLAFLQFWNILGAWRPSRPPKSTSLQPRFANKEDLPQDLSVTPWICKQNIYRDVRSVCKIAGKLYTYYLSATLNTSFLVGGARSEQTPIRGAWIKQSWEPLLWREFPSFTPLLTALATGVVYVSVHHEFKC